MKKLVLELIIANKYYLKENRCFNMKINFELSYLWKFHVEFYTNYYHHNRKRKLVKHFSGPYSTWVIFLKLAIFI